MGGGDDRLAASAPEPSSWGEAMQQYTMSRTQRPRPDSEYVKPKRVTAYEKKRQETQYHPILQTFTQPTREKAAQDFESSGQITAINKARDRQVATESRFNIITMEDKRRGLPKQPEPSVDAMTASFDPSIERPTFRHPLDSCFQYNIVSNLPLTTHHYTAPDLRPNVDESAGEPKPRLQHVAGLPRDFNILSNKYRDSHDEKVALEREVQRRTAAKKYWETHDYEPLTCTYLDPSKEDAFQRSQEVEMAKQPMKQFNRLPPSLQKGEGFVYDITTHVVKNKDLYDRKKASEQAWFDSRSWKWKRDEEIRDKSAQRQQLDDQRAINRAAHTRYVEKFQYGYNIVDHRDYRHDPAPMRLDLWRPRRTRNPETYMPPPRTRPELTLWESVGTDRPPKAPPPPPPPPMPAPLLSTIPSGVRTGGFKRAGVSAEVASAPA